jgi:hypothetical protein
MGQLNIEELYNFYHSSHSSLTCWIRTNDIEISIITVWMHNNFIYKRSAPRKSRTFSLGLEDPSQHPAVGA